MRNRASPLRLMVQLENSSVDMIQAKSNVLCQQLAVWPCSKMMCGIPFIHYPCRDIVALCCGTTSVAKYGTGSYHVKLESY